MEQFYYVKWNNLKYRKLVVDFEGNNGAKDEVLCIFFVHVLSVVFASDILTWVLSIYCGLS